MTDDNNTLIATIIESDETYVLSDSATGTKYYLDSQTGTVVTELEDGTKLLPTFATPKDGNLFFGQIIDRIEKSTNRAPEIYLGSKLIDKNVMPDNGWREAATVAKRAGKILTEASKALGPIGIVATLSEISVLEEKAKCFLEWGIISEKILNRYDKVLASNLVGFDLATMATHDLWASHNDVPEYIKHALKPDTFLETLLTLGSNYGNREIIKDNAYQITQETTRIKPTHSVNPDFESNSQFFPSSGRH